MTIINLSVGRSDYSRAVGFDLVFFCLRLSVAKSERWHFSGSLFYNVRFLTWAF